MDHPAENAVLVAPYCAWMDGTVVELDQDDSIHRFIAREDFRYAEDKEIYMIGINFDSELKNIAEFKWERV